MTVYYVDPIDGKAGTGDGSSFANRASGVNATESTILNNLAAGDEIRFKKSPDITTLTTCKVNDKNPNTSYYSQNISLGSNGFSSTPGQTEFSCPNHYCETGDFIFITNETSLAAGNRIDGLWKVTVVDANNLKLDGYVAPSSGSISSAKMKNVSSNVLELNTSNIVKVLYGGNDVDGTRHTWTAAGSNTVTVENDHSNSAWGSSNVVYAPEVIKVTVPASQGNGTKLAYASIGSHNLSNYQQISFRLRAYGGQGYTEAGAVKLALCSDSSGSTIVHETPSISTTTNGGNNWQQGYSSYTFDMGSALGSNINSIALYSSNSMGQTHYYYIDQIIVSKASNAADCLTFNSLVSLNTTADPCWHSVGYIRGNYLMHDIGRSAYDNRHPFSYYTGGGYFRSASNNSATLYVRQPSLLTRMRESNNNSGYSNGVITISSKNGTANNYIKLSGGWDTTNMSTQTGETFLDAQGCKPEFMNLNQCNYFEIEKLHSARFYRGNNINYCDYLKVHLNHQVENYYQSILNRCENVQKFQATTSHILNGYSWQFNQTYFDKSVDLSNFYCVCNHNSHNGQAMIMVNGNQADVRFDLIDVRGCSKTGVKAYQNSKFYAKLLKAGHSGTGGGSGSTMYALHTTNTPPPNSFIVDELISYGVSNGYILYDACGMVIKKWTHSIWLDSNGNPDQNKSNGYVGTAMAQLQSTSKPTTIGETGGSTVYGRFSFANNGLLRLYDVEHTNTGTLISTSNMGKVEVVDYDGVTGDIRTFFPSHTVVKETTITQTGSGTAWKQEFNNTGTSAETFNVAKIAVNGGSQVTVSVYIRRGNSDVYGGIHILPNGLAGVDAVSVLNNTSTVDQWVQISATCTPTAAGIIEVALGGYKTASSSSNVVYYDTFSATQA